VNAVREMNLLLPMRMITSSRSALEILSPNYCDPIDRSTQLTDDLKLLARTGTDVGQFLVPNTAGLIDHTVVGRLGSQTTQQR
jgi:hypothetical protein